ncbi:hypothetical protein DFH29DRAFT_1039258 [Suillus ampliporus]|nr:hypothetical protein DFH29DRAFT_1039258 [Suillus ampliporus]
MLEQRPRDMGAFSYTLANLPTSMSLPGTGATGRLSTSPTIASAKTSGLTQMMLEAASKLPQMAPRLEQSPRAAFECMVSRTNAYLQASLLMQSYLHILVPPLSLQVHSLLPHPPEEYAPDQAALMTLPISSHQPSHPPNDHAMTMANMTTSPLSHDERWKERVIMGTVLLTLAAFVAQTIAEMSSHGQPYHSSTKPGNGDGALAADHEDEPLEENVSYVVAPYEADAQMAYLERVGLVDGIIKTRICLSSDVKRDDFGSVTAAERGISLLGWLDAQFRAMAILS